MGKKNFIDGYDPFANQIQKDGERIAALARAQEVEAVVAPAVSASSSPARPAPTELRGRTSETIRQEVPTRLDAPAPRPHLDLQEDDDADPPPPATLRRVPSDRPPAAATMVSRPNPANLQRGRESDAPPERAVAPRRIEDDTAETSPRFKVSMAAYQDLTATLQNIYRLTGSQIHYGIATRALWELLVGAEAQIQEELRKHPLGRLPSTRDRVAYAEYQDKVRQVFGSAFRKLPRSLFLPPPPTDEQAEG